MAAQKNLVGTNSPIDDRSATKGATGEELGRPLADQPGAGVEPDLPPTGRLFLQILLLSLLLVGVIVGLWEIFYFDSTAEIYQKELSLPNKELLELEARDEGRLTQYDVTDAKQGIYQIPIRRAMDLLLEKPDLLAPISAPAAMSTPPSVRKEKKEDSR